MFHKLSIFTAAALLMSACSKPEVATSPPPPAPPPAASALLFFDFDRATLTEPARGTVRQAAAAYKAGGGARGISATGHADRSGSDAYNMALSTRRANAVKDALVREGVPAAAITVAGRGESQPLVQTADGVREPQNRRVEIAGVGAGASPNDLAYCKEMSARYRRYLGNVLAQGDVAEAIYQCDQGNTERAIPVLEKHLTDAKIALPPRM